MILHLVHDDKVVPRMIKLFDEYCPSNNIFVCVTRKKHKSQLRFLKDSNIILSYSREAQKLPWDKIEKICIHYLDIHKILFLYTHRSPIHIKKIKIIWFMWGGDIYEYLERRGFHQYSENNSFRHIKTSYPKIFGVKSVDNCLGYIIFNLISDIVLKYFYTYRINYIVSSIEEFNLFESYIHFTNFKELLEFSYYSIEDTIGILANCHVSGNGVMIGNSASPSNNHEYIYEYIKKLDFSDKRIFLPVSYGREEKYLLKVYEKYSNIHNVSFLNDFLPLDSYNELMTNCTTFIYGNFRQEAWGNILIALYLGGKVYLSKYSPLFDYCKRLGFVLFTLEDIRLNFDRSLSDNEKNHNKNISLKEFSRKKNEINIKYINNI